MKPILIVKTINGYVCMEYSGEIPQADLQKLHVATALDRLSWRTNDSTVQQIISAHFEPLQVAQEAA